MNRQPTAKTETMARSSAEYQPSGRRPVRRVVMCGPALNQANTGDRLLVGTLAAILRDALGVERITYGAIDADPRVAHDVRKI